jgi:hypothetical protein
VILVHIPWAVNPWRGDKFAEGWAPAAEAVLDYGAVSWGFYRAIEGRLDFIQQAVFPSKAATDGRSALLQRSQREPAPAELLPVVLGQLARA